MEVLRNTKNLYRGFGVVAALSFPAHALYFIAYEESKRQLGDGDSVRIDLCGCCVLCAANAVLRY